MPTVHCRGAFQVASGGHRQHGNVHRGPRQFPQPRLADADPSSFFIDEPPKPQKSKHHHQYFLYNKSAPFPRPATALRPFSVYLFPGPFQLPPRAIPPISPPTPFTNWVAVCPFLFVFDTPIDRSSSYLYNVVHAGAPDPAEAAASGPKQGAHRKRPGCN